MFRTVCHISPESKHNCPLRPSFRPHGRCPPIDNKYLMSEIDLVPADSEHEAHWQWLYWAKSNSQFAEGVCDISGPDERSPPPISSIVWQNSERVTADLTHRTIIVSTRKTLNATIGLVILIMFYKLFKSQLLGMKWVFKYQDLQMFELKLKRKWVIFTSFFGRGNETQLQVGDFFI